ncbi:TM2 domain-containing protein almondex [Oopsacas minuta]|uniref:TM2 domain-containing protein almondex n=1 Tax=Oopsacas minuta TaxID=111878 RepID=A0AAV7JVV4_9METZ|nr:TM2 domain-containing protein almondex [Oopsacas minuta]
MFVFSLLCIVLLLPFRSQTHALYPITKIVPSQRYAFLPSINCTTQLDSIPCSEYKQCLTCTEITTDNCHFGDDTDANCSYSDTLKCSGDKYSMKRIPCKYCYQLISLSVSVQFQDQQPAHLRMGIDYECANFTNNDTSSCPSVATPRALYLSQCRVLPHVECLGKRIFFVQRPCKYTSGYKWSTAFILSVLLGGLGIDRFYLLHWRTGLGKLVSFGGLGVWSLLDILLIGTGFLKPADGSLYE